MELDFDQWEADFQSGGFQQPQPYQNQAPTYSPNNPYAPKPQRPAPSAPSNTMAQNQPLPQVGQEPAANVLPDNTLNFDEWENQFQQTLPEKTLRQAWETGVAQKAIGELQFKRLSGQKLTPEETQQLGRMKEITGKQYKDPSFVSGALQAAAEMVPIMAQAGLKGLEYAGYGAGVGAAVGAAGGAAGGPLAGVTAASGAGAGARVGMMYGSAHYMYQTEAGLAYDEFLERGIDPEIAGYAAQAVGTVNGLLELAQLGLILRTIPGAKKFLGQGVINKFVGKVAQKFMTESVKKPSVKKAVALAAQKFAFGYMLPEVTQEELQEASNVIGDTIATHVSNELKGTNVDPLTYKEIKDRMVDVAWQSTQAFFVLGAPGSAVKTYRSAKSAKKAGVAYDMLMGEDISGEDTPDVVTGRRDANIILNQVRESVANQPPPPEGGAGMVYDQPRPPMTQDAFGEMAQGALGYPAPPIQGTPLTPEQEMGQRASGVFEGQRLPEVGQAPTDQLTRERQLQDFLAPQAGEVYRAGRMEEPMPLTDYAGQGIKPTPETPVIKEKGATEMAAAAVGAETPTARRRRHLMEAAPKAKERPAQKAKKETFDDFVQTLSEDEKGYIKDLIKDTGMPEAERLGLAKAEILARKEKAKISYQRDLEKARKVAKKPSTEKVEDEDGGKWTERGRVTVHGMPTQLETKKGEERVKGIKVKFDVGRFRDVKGADGGDVDVIYGPEGDNTNVFVIDQMVDGKFDEHKVMTGFKDANQAKMAHRTTYGTTAKVGRVVEMTPTEFKKWMAGKNRTKPVAQTPPISEKEWMEKPEVRPAGYLSKKFIPSAKGKHAQATNRAIVAEYRQWLKNRGYAKPAPTAYEAEVKATRKDDRSAPIRWLEAGILGSQKEIEKEQTVLGEKPKYPWKKIKAGDIKEVKRLTADQKVAKWLSDLLGIDLAFYEGQSFGASGIFVHGPNTIAIHAGTDKPAVFVLLHEAVHNMSEEDTGTYNRLRQYLWNNRSLPDFQMYSDALNASRMEAGLKPLPANPYRAETKGMWTTFDEYMAEGIAQMGFEKKFWDTLQTKNPSLFGKLIAFITKMLDGIRAKIKATETQDLNFFLKAEEELYDTVSDAFMKFAARRQSGNKLAKQESIVAAAIMYDGTVYTGANHGVAWEKAEKAAGKEIGITDPKFKGDGFLTTKGRFVDRDVAMTLAKAADQVRETMADREYLISEALSMQPEHFTKEDPVQMPPKYRDILDDMPVHDEFMRGYELEEAVKFVMTAELAIRAYEMASPQDAFVKYYKEFTEEEFHEVADDVIESMINVYDNWLKHHDSAEGWVDTFFDPEEEQGFGMAPSEMFEGSRIGVINTPSWSINVESEILDAVNAEHTDKDIRDLRETDRSPEELIELAGDYGIDQEEWKQDLEDEVFDDEALIQRIEEVIYESSMADLPYEMTSGQELAEYLDQQGW